MLLFSWLNKHKRKPDPHISIKKYMFLAALDKRTCKKCGNLDGETFNISDAKVGMNYPPMHEGCRCTTIKLVPGFHPSQRIARNPKTNKNYYVSGDTRYKDWAKEWGLGK
jgi:uncharacterized protein with gpF-like domain